MRCDQCNRETETFVACDCFTTLCPNCFIDHDCPHKGNARLDSAFTPTANREPAPKRIAIDAGAFKLRPYQQKAIEAVIEELT